MRPVVFKRKAISSFIQLVLLFLAVTSSSLLAQTSYISERHLPLSVSKITSSNLFAQTRYQESVEPQISTIATIEDSFIYVKSTITLPSAFLSNSYNSKNNFIDNKPPVTIQFPIVNIDQVNGISKSLWKIEKDNNGLKLIINLQKTKDDLFPLTFSVSFHQEILNKSNFMIPVPVILDATRVNGEIGMGVKGNLQIKSIKVEGGEAIDVSELSSNIGSFTDSILFAYAYHKEIKLTPEIDKITEVPVLNGTIDTANALSVVSSHGKILTRVIYQIKINQVQYLTLVLPPHATLFSTSVNDNPVKPLITASNDILIPLKHLSPNMTGKAEITYFTSQPHFKLGGSLKNLLPKPAFPISELIWSVYIPQKDHLIFTSGNLEEIKGAYDNNIARPNMGNNMPTLQRDKMSFYDTDERYDDNSINKKQIYSRQRKIKVAQDRLENEMSISLKPNFSAVPEPGVMTVPGTIRQGVYPVMFYIPEKGTPVRFSGLFIMNEFPQANITYIGGAAFGFVKLLLFVTVITLLGLIVRHIYLHFKDKTSIATNVTDVPKPESMV